MNSLFWTKAPFVRLIAPFIAGIILQYHHLLNTVAEWYKETPKEKYKQTKNKE